MDCPNIMLLTKNSKNSYFVPFSELEKLEESLSNLSYL